MTSIILQTGQIMKYSIMRHKTTHERFVCLSDGRVIPAAIAGMAAGRDRWLSEIKCKCQTCGESFPLRELGETGQWCEACASADIQDN